MRAYTLGTLCTLCLLLAAPLGAGCASEGTDPFHPCHHDPNGDDTRSPSFGGVGAVTADTPHSLRLTWAQATDDKTDPNCIEYRVYLATTSGSQDLTKPPASFIAGTAGGLVGGLAPSTQYFVIVRAVDSAGNMEHNAVEKAVPTPAEPAPAMVSLARDLLPIFDQNCAADPQCHKPTAIQRGLDLVSAESAFESLVNRPSSEHPEILRVQPGDSGQSYLVRKILGLLNKTTDGMAMPYPGKGYDPLCDCGSCPKLAPAGSNPCQIDLIRAWIDEGAPNN